MKNVKQFLLLFLMICAATLAMAQQRQVSGTVKDNEGAPIAGATVLEKSTDNGVATDESGNFTITVSGANPVLVISSVGYQTFEFAVGNTLKPTITLSPGSGDLDEGV